MSRYDTSTDGGMNLNVGGRKFILKPKQLDRLPRSRLAKLYKTKSRTPASLALLCDDVRFYDVKNNDVKDSDVGTEYFFDRDPESFLYIMAAYRGASIHAPKSVCAMRLSEEMKYWEIDLCLLDACCTERLETATTLTGLNMKNISQKMEQYYLKQEEIKFLPKMTSWDDVTYNLHTLRLRAWSVVEDPSSSIIAKIWTLTSVAFIIISLVCFVTGTVPGYYEKDAHGQEHEIESLATIEKVCMVWFTIEYITRLIVAPEKVYFIRQILNVIDLLTIIPFFIQQFKPEAANGIQTWQHLTQVFRIMRVLRIFRLGRHSNGLKLLCVTLYQSSNELIMLSIFLMIGIVMLATLVFSFESHDLFPNLGEALWFAAVTITTVGYGDIVPETIAGKVVTSTSFLVGVIAIAMPIHPIISNFSNCYRTQREMENAFKRALKVQKKDQERDKQRKSKTSLVALTPQALLSECDATTTDTDTDMVLTNFHKAERERRYTFAAIGENRSLSRCKSGKRLSLARKKRQSCVGSLVANSVFSVSAGLDLSDHDKKEDVCYCIFCTDADDE
nr:potassium voltage-gated channel subfamily B member 2 isoform X1 [Ciona intestinalis]|eukprot:XP_002130030.1 potassium voltage-gated channel subfamily B member 2 isoform X1 [Ciona intestinalis]